MLELESSISGKIRKYNNFFSIWARKFHFQWIIFSLFGFGMENAGFRLREYKEFFNIWARKFYFPKYKEFFGGVGFFLCLSFGLKSVPDGSITYYLHYKLNTITDMLKLPDKSSYVILNKFETYIKMKISKTTGFTFAYPVLNLYLSAVLILKISNLNKSFNSYLCISFLFCWDNNLFCSYYSNAQ